MKQLLLTLVATLFAACQSQTAEVSTTPASAPAPTPLSVAKPSASGSKALDWPVGYVDTLQPKTPRPLPLTPSSAAAFVRLPAAAPDTSEANSMRKAGAGVQRTGKTLTLPLCQGTQKLLTYDRTDNPDSSVTYRFAGTVPGANQWLVATSLWEGFYYLLVDRCSGRRQYAWNFPVPSPDQRFFIVANSDLEARYAPTGLQLWTVMPTGVRKIWQREWPANSESGPASVRWQNAHTVIIKEEFITDKAPPRYVALDLAQLAKR